jgi:acid phosphatase type 7
MWTIRHVQGYGLVRPVRLLRILASAVTLSLVFAAVSPAAFLGPLTVPLVAAASDPVIAAAGDIACDPTNSNFNGGNGSSSSCRQRYTSDLLVNGNFAAVIALGDNQYYCGGYSAFLQSYALSWGRVKSITHPAVGNHEYLTSGGTGCDPTNTGAAGYFKYFGASAGDPTKGYYSLNIGAWHVVALNSNCSSAGGCGSTSPQYKWLQADLAAHRTTCTLAYWHIPLYSSGGRSASNMQKLWQVLYDNNADLVLEGHDHIYERFAPQNATALLDKARGLRSFIVGTGGANHTSVTSVAANSEVRNASTYGILKLTLHASSYDWQFVHEAGKTFTDSGTTSCH